VLDVNQQARTYHLNSWNRQFAPQAQQIGFSFIYDSAANYRGIQGSLAAEVPTISLNNAHRFDVKKSVHEAWLRNLTNTSVFLTRYTFVVRDDTDSAVNSPTEFLSNPSAMFVQGFVNQGLSATFYQNVNVTPFENFDFCRLLKITRVRHYKLGVGASKKITTKKRNYQVPYAKCIDVDSVLLKGITTGDFFLLHGDVIGGSGVTIAEAAVATIHQSTFQIRNSTDYLTDLKKSFYLPPLTTSVATMTNYSTTTSIPVTSA